MIKKKKKKSLKGKKGKKLLRNKNSKANKIFQSITTQRFTK